MGTCSRDLLKSVPVGKAVFSAKRGSVALEAVISIGVFTIFTLVCLNFALYFYQQLVLQYITNKWARTASIGDVVPDGRNLRITSYTANDIKTEIQNSASNYNIPLTAADIRICALPETCPVGTPNCILNATANCTTPGLGNALQGQSYFIAVARPFRAFFGHFQSLELRAQAIGRHEGGTND